VKFRQLRETGDRAVHDPACLQVGGGVDIEGRQLGAELLGASLLLA
jgi:hypothetical protein